MKRYRKYFFQSLSAIALGLMLMGSEEVPAFAQRQPVFTNDLERHGSVALFIESKFH